MKAYPLVTSALLLSFIALACKPYRFSQSVDKVEHRSYQSAYFITDTAAYPTRKIVGELKVMDEAPWPQMKTKIQDLSIKNHANAIFIEEYRLGGKILRGKVYQIEEGELLAQKTLPFERQLFIFRDEMEHKLSPFTNCKVSLQETKHELKDCEVLPVSLSPDQDSIQLELNGKALQFPLLPGDNYLWLSRQTQTQRQVGAINMSIGGFNAQMLKDPERGKIWVNSFDPKAE